MEFTVISEVPQNQKGDCIVIGIFASRKLSASAQQVDDAANGFLSNLLEHGDMEGKKGQTSLLYNVPNISAKRVLLIGCGKESDFNERHYLEVTRKAVNLLQETGAAEIVSFLPQLEIKGRSTHWKVRQAVEVSIEALYRFNQLKSEPETTQPPLKKIVLAVPASEDIPTGQVAIDQGQGIGLGINLAKDLGNLPGNICTPSYLAEQAKELQKKYGIKTTILEESDMEKLGMGALLSVTRGSREPAKLIIMEYQGGDQAQAPVALVGKGLTFDAGGISLKPADKMDQMKYDMCGAASVFGTLKAVAEFKLPINVIGVVPSSENLPDGNANKPGDIVTSMSGQTIEILNTDAEGRLILCDALTYTEKFNPKAVIDIATLTGACVVALGEHAIGLFSNNDELAQEIISAGNTAYDRAWQLPLWEDYQPQLDSNFADMANVGGRPAGAVTAACFLSRYTKKFKWAHLDIAGTAWKMGKEKGATGRPVALLTQFLIDQSAND